MEGRSDVRAVGSAEGEEREQEEDGDAEVGRAELKDGSHGIKLQYS